jgi:hypothetical protein
MAEPIHLHHVYDYTDVDRAFWAEHIEGWLPQRVIDAHTHITNPAHRREPMTDEMLHQYWVAEVSRPIDAENAARWHESVFPGRDFSCVAVGPPSLAYDIEASNEYLRTQCLKRGWWALSVCPPQWTAEQVAGELAKPGVLGIKPYYTLIGRDPSTRDRYIEADILDYLPEHVLEVLNERRAWVTLHVPKADRLPHPDNIRRIREIRERYPDVVIVIAHFGRCYTEPHAREGLPPLADDEGLYFDNSAVYNPAVHRLALELFGPQRILHGTDNPVFYMRGRRQWEGRRYINRTSYPFHFNKEREAPEIEAAYTLYTYEALQAIRGACEDLQLSRDDVEAIFHGNAERLIAGVMRNKEQLNGQQ